MGCGSVNIPSEPSQLLVATLNYSGILLSPYEFHEKFNDEEIELSKLMNKISKQYNFTEFQFGPFERQWQKKRYSPLYIPTCGIKNNVSMMSQIQFIQQWKNWLEKCKQEVSDIYQLQKDKVLGKKNLNNDAKANSDEKAKDETNLDGKNKKKNNQKIFLSKQKYLDNLLKFDLISYRVILQFVYTQITEINQIKNNFKKQQKQYNSFQLNAAKYRKHRKEKFKKSFLNENQKIQKTIQALQKLNLDILFLQEASTQIVQAIQKRTNQFRIVKFCKPNSKQLDVKSVILIKEKKFPKITSLLQQNKRILGSKSQLKNAKIERTKLTQQQIKMFNLNKDTVMQVIYNIILVCPHLTSKQEKNQMQMIQLKNLCILLKTKFPQCYVMIGGDLNNKTLKPFKIQVEGKQIFFNVVPDCLNNFTVFKKRTQLQAQKEKAGKVNQQTKDYIITDLQIKQAKIKTVDGKVIAQCQIKDSKQVINNAQTIFNQTRNGSQGSSKVSMLPTDDHPYDHFMVVATIQLPSQGLQHVTDKKYLYKNQPSKLTEAQILEVEEQLVQNKKK